MVCGKSGKRASRTLAGGPSRSSNQDLPSLFKASGCSGRGRRCGTLHNLRLFGDEGPNLERSSHRRQPRASRRFGNCVNALRTMNCGQGRHADRPPDRVDPASRRRADASGCNHPPPHLLLQGEQTSKKASTTPFEPQGHAPQPSAWPRRCRRCRARTVEMAAKTARLISSWRRSQPVGRT